MTTLKPERLSLADCIDQPVSLCGKGFRAHKSGGLFWAAQNALIVSDLHLEKGSSFAARGQMLPPYDTKETLARLADVIDFYRAATVICLGDSFQDAGARERMSGDDLETLRILQDDREWIWVTGNHDHQIDRSFGGHVLSALTVDGMRLCHEPGRGAVSHEIAGHLHPAARLVMNGTALRRRCFAGNGRRLVLPAFGAFTGGLNVLDDAFQPILGLDGLHIWMLGQEGLYPIAPRLLREDV